MRFICASITAIGLAGVMGVASAEDGLVKFGGLRIYSSLTYERTEGDFNGEQIVVIPSSDGEKILWRQAEGVIEPPLLLDVTKQDDQFKVKHPETGEWTFQVKGAFLEGVNSKGIKIRLKQVLPK